MFQLFGCETPVIDRFTIRTIDFQASQLRDQIPITMGIKKKNILSISTTHLDKKAKKN